MEIWALVMWLSLDSMPAVVTGYASKRECENGLFQFDLQTVGRAPKPHAVCIPGPVAKDKPAH